MPQISLYMDDAMLTKAKSGALAEGISLSRYAANAIRERLEAPKSMVEEGYWDRLYGCLADDDSFMRPPQPETRPIPSFDAT